MLYSTQWSICCDTKLGQAAPNESVLSNGVEHTDENAQRFFHIMNCVHVPKG